MKIYDISQEVFTCTVYPGDRAPRMMEELRMSRGGLYNLSSFEMCAHNGTHIDAPFHFLADGDTVDKIPLEKTVGNCFVIEQNEDIDRACAERIISLASLCKNGSERRILIKGSGTVTEDGARGFADAGIFLLGVEGQTVGPEDAPMAVHKILLDANAVLLEGIRLSAVHEGTYFLNAAPINLGGCDGAPCRAILIENKGEKT